MKKISPKLIITLISIAMVVLGIYFLGSSRYLSLEHVKASAQQLELYVAGHYILSSALFMFISALLVAFTLPVTAPVGVVGGFLFGIWPGVLYCMIATLVGAGISFLIVRYTLSQVTQHQYGNQLESFSQRMAIYGHTYLITLQLLTVVPYFVINTLAALAGVSFITFMWTTAVGSFPIVMIYAFAGRQLYKINSWKDIISKEMLILLVLLAALAMLPMLLKKMRFSSAKGTYDEARKNDDDNAPMGF